ncbi:MULTISPECIES: hydrogenase/urease maturation nickel metallochaperone HypA [Nonomuraea]|uniref:Hydrogenase/urease maturation nickel metallochaperone HypA n=1 Tax=Nonomuraea ferruginea TaxID=46174 RepID=A0ABT4T6M5_9ACTN|nr:hydrogenase/urease maturation nickel metallochaperone HypA [Nonomuraea ferruginea]MDA0645142.1 hydrogenase/urease maturation nickel metallochaperone HypA [Nonomuraea ferruginea]
MHETGMCDEIVRAVLLRAEGRRVAAVRVRAAVTGHAVDPAVVDQGFRVAAAGTAAEDAQLELVAAPPTMSCHDCGARTPAASALVLVACPRCGGVDVEVAGDTGVVVESITYQSDVLTSEVP